MPKKFNAQAGQSIYDVCLNTYGTFDQLVKLLRDSGNQGVNDVPFSGQAFVYDETLVADQQVSQITALRGRVYATLATGNGSYYIINQGRPHVIPPPVPGGPVPPTPTPGNDDYMIGQTQFVSSADGTTIITPVDADGNSMIGYDVIALEKEIRPIENLPSAPAKKWSWSKLSGILTLLNGTVLDYGETLFILYNKPL